MHRRGGARGDRFSSRGGGGNRFNSTAFKGLFKDNIWHCNCTPRLPAEHFKVKKEGKNQGRWFYTCQQKEPERCDFFLWDEDARLRMEGAVLAGKSDEIRTDEQAGWSAGRGRADERSAGRGMFAGVGNRARIREDDEESLSPTPPPPYDSQKRSAQMAGIDEDDDASFPWPLTGEEEARLTLAVDAVGPATPYKAQKTGIYATPATSTRRNLPWLEESTASNTISDENALRPLTPSKSPSKLHIEQPFTPGGQAPETTIPSSPSPPARHKNALLNPADSTSSLTSEALAALASTSIPPDTLSRLRSVLTKHDLRTQGVTKGRDISRLAVKAKDAKIAELHARIASLEAEREMDRAVMRLRG